MKFKTKSGSEYEVDHATSRIRRLSGTHAPTNSQGPDGEWRHYHIALVELGKRAVIKWHSAAMRATVTTPVVGINNE